jgi:hypothetical protein
MYNIRRATSKSKLSNFVNGVSQENFLFLLYFLFTGVFVFVVTPFFVENHKRAVARNEWRKTQKSLPLSFTTGMPINTRRISQDSSYPTE